MKKYISILCLSMMFLWSCDSTFLEPNPESLVTPENLNDPELLLRGAFGHLRSDNNNSWKYVTNLVVNFGNDEVIYNNFKSESGSTKDLSTFGFTTSDGDLRSVYIFLYGGVNISNHAISVAKRVGDVKVEAEARFIRGFYYYMLATLYGGVPLIKNFEDDPKTQRSSMEETLLFIESDWKFAVENAPDTPVMAGRTTKLTALAYLAKLYLFIASCKENNIDNVINGTTATLEQKKLLSFNDWNDTRTIAEFYTLAQTYAEQVYNKYTLVDNYRDNFRKSGEDDARDNEWIFAIENSDLPINESNPSAINSGNAFHMQNNKFLVPNYEFYDMYIPEDTRIGNSGRNNIGSTPIETIGSYKHFEDTTPNREGGLALYIWTKWRADLATGLHKRWLTSGLALLRYSDMILVLAEAKYKNGDETGARELLKEVRMRATSTTSTKDETILDLMTTAYYKADFMQELMDERKRELCVEGHRRVDLIRTGTIFSSINKLTTQNNKGTLWKQGGASVQAMKDNLAAHPYRIWFPIPNEQIIIGKYLQNPGYPTNE